MTQRAFVGGATGHTGREVVRQLCEAGIETVAHIRPNSSKLEHWQEQFGAWGSKVSTAAWGTDEIARDICEFKPDLVFGLLGTTKARAKRAAQAGRDAAKESYEAVDLGLTLELLEAAKQSGSSPCFVYLSSAGASSGMGHYLKIRQQVESLLTQSELPYIIARPGIIIGERDESRPLEEIGAVINDSFSKLIGGIGLKKLSDRYRSTTNIILARALVRSALNPQDRFVILESENLR